MKRWLFAVMILSCITAWCEDAKSTSTVVDTNRLGQLIQTGKQLYEDGKLAQAATTLKQALKVDPTNKAAAYYLDLVKEGVYRNRAQARQDLGSGDIHPTNPPRSAATGEWMSNHPLKIAEKTIQFEKLASRSFHLDAVKFAQKLQFAPDEESKLRSSGELTFIVPGNHSVKRHEQIKAWMRSLGVDLNSAGTSVFYNDRKGLLLVRAKEDDLVIIANAVAPMLAKADANTGKQP